MKLWHTLGSLLLSLLACTPAQSAENRLALVIDNSAYRSEVGSLSGPAADAERIVTVLEKLNFQVQRQSDLPREKMQNAFSNFADRLRNAGPDAVGFIYYAGHGVADRRRGENYLLPTDAAPPSIDKLPEHSVPLGTILDSLEASGGRAAILVLDACRDVPLGFAQGSGRGLVDLPRKEGAASTSSAQDGAPLSFRSAKTDTLVAFATAPGRTAADDGFFARVLAEELARPGATSTTAFDQVKERVAVLTNRQQMPRIDNGLVRPIVFSPGGGGPWVGVEARADNTHLEPESFTDHTVSVFFADLIVRAPGSFQRCDFDVRVNYILSGNTGSRSKQIAVPLTDSAGQVRAIDFKVPKGARDFSVDAMPVNCF